ncbi:hypothetical protein ACQ4PT_056105 [Festuca glaucescens]
MVVSFKISRRGRRFYPPPPASTSGAADPPPPAASPYGSPLPPPPPWHAAAAPSGIAVRSGVLGRIGTDPADLGEIPVRSRGAELEPSFALNLFPDGYTIGGLDKGMLVFLIGDDSEKKPYTRASRALLSDIEYGCLPQDILHGIPCKFRNGIVVCEVRDYRPFLSNGGDSSGYDFPKMNRVALRLGTECVIKDLSLIADPSWTYHHQLIAESTIINSLQPRLNLDPTPCLEKLCNSVKKIDLGLNKGRQQTKDTSLLSSSTDPPEKCKPKECDNCEDAAVCIERSALEVFPARVFCSSPVNCSSSAQVNNPKSTVMSDPEETIQRSSTLRNSSALCDRKQSASGSPAPDHSLQNHEQQVELAIVQVDHKNGQSPRETVLSQKRKQSLNLPRERRPSNKSARMSFQSPKGQFQKSIGTSNKKRLKLGSPKESPVEVKVDQTIGKKDMRVQQQKTFSVIPTNRLIPSLNRNDPCLEKLPEKVKQGSQKELLIEVKVDQMIGKKDTRGHGQKPFSVIRSNQPLPSLSRNSPCSDKFFEKDKVISQKELPIEVKVDQTMCKNDMREQKNEPLSMLQTNGPHPSLNRNSLHAENIPVKVHSSHITMNERHLASTVNLDSHSAPEIEVSAMTPVSSCDASSGKAAAGPNEDKVSTEPKPTTLKRDASRTSPISLNQQASFKGKCQKQADILDRRLFEDGGLVEPGVADSTTSRFGISPDIELCIRHPLYNIEPDIEKILSEVILITQRHALNGNASKIEGVETLRPSSSCSPSHFFRYGSAGGSPYMREETIACHPTTGTKNTRNIGRYVFHRVQYFCRGIIDQSHYILCLRESESPEDHQIAVVMISGDEHIHIATLPTYDQARKLVDQFILLMKRDGYALCNSTVCNGFSVLRQQSGDVSQLGYLTGEHSQYQGFSPCVAKSVVINECQDTSFSFQKRLQDVQGNVRQQGSQQWGLPDVHSNVLHQGSQQWGLPDVHSNVLHQGSQQCGLPDAQANVRQLGNTQQWRLPDAHANVRKQGSDQQWELPYVHANVPHKGSNQQWGLPGAHANVSHQGSSQQWGLPGAQTNVVHQGSNQQWGLPSAHANVPHQGRQQWGLPDPHANLLPQGRHQWGMPDVHGNALHQGSQQWVQPGQCPTMASVDTSHFLNPNYPAEQQYNSRVPGGVCSMDQHQHHYLQNRHPGSSDRYATSMNTGFYDQWHQTPQQQLSSRTHQWGFQDFGRQTNSMPQMHAGRGMRLSVPHPVGSPQMSSPTTGSDVSVTSFLVPPSYPYPPHGNGIS